MQIIDKINTWLESHAGTNIYRLIPLFLIMTTFIFAAYGIAHLTIDDGNYSLPQWFYGAFGFLGGNGPLDKLNHLVSLQIAAFLAPISVVSTLIYIFGKKLRLWLFLTFQKRGHIIVCGLGLNNRYYIDSELENEKPESNLGEKAIQGHYIDSELENEKPYIVVIEKDKDNTFIEKYENKGVFFLFGDADSKDLLEEAGVKTCKHIIVSTGNDSVNLNISALLKEIIQVKKILPFQQKQEDEQKAFIHISQRALELYADKNLFYGEFFSYYENACRDLFLSKKNLTYGVDTVNSDESVKLLIVGFGMMGQEVAFNALKLGSFANKKKLEITIVDHDPKSYDSFLYHFPKATDIATIKFMCLEILSPEFSKQILDNFDFTYTVTALAKDDLTLELLHLLNSTLSQRNFLENQDTPKPLPPIAVRFLNNNNIDISKINVSMFQFALSREISDRKNIVYQELDKYARALSTHYNKKDKWGGTSNFEKDTNRAAVDHYFVVKKEILEKKKIDFEDVSIELKEMLIDVEHTRWVNFHLLNGWKHKHAKIWRKNHEVKEEYQKHRLHTCLVSTDCLDDLSKQHQFDYKNNDFQIYEILFRLEK